MKSKVIFAILGAVAGFVIAFILFEGSVASNEKPPNYNVGRNQDLNPLYEEAFKLQQSNWSMQLDSIVDIPIVDQYDSVYHLRSMFEEKVLILYLNAKMCSPCVEQELENFYSLVQQSGVRGALLTEGYRQDYVFRDPVFSKPGITTYMIKKLFFYRAQMIFSPVVLYVDKGGKILLAYNTPKNFPSFNDALVRAIKN